MSPENKSYVNINVLFSCCQHSPNSFCIPSSLLSSQMFSIPCSENSLKNPVKDLIISRLLYHCHNIFPIAYCSSNYSNSITENGGEDSKDSFGLPGIQTKRKPISATNVIGEFDINRYMETESGWDRVKYMYRMKSGQFQDEGTQALNTMLYRTVVMGFFLSAIVESSKESKMEKSLSRTEAVRKGVASQILLPKRVFLTALRDTFKLSIVAFSILHVSQTISAYKNKTAVWEFALCSAFGFGAIGVSKGLSKFGAYTIGGAMLGSVGGWVVCKVLQSSGLTQEIRSMKRMQHKVEVERLEMESAMKDSDDDS